MKNQKNTPNAEGYLFYYEHKMIPSLLFSDDMDFFGVLSENPDVLFEIFRDACAENKVPQTYTADDFAVELAQPADGWYGLTLTFPIPQHTGFCYDIYLFQKKDRSERGCYTLERTADKKGEDRLLLGSWDAKSRHMEHDKFPLEDDDYFAKAFAIHRRKIEETEGKS